MAMFLENLGFDFFRDDRDAFIGFLKLASTESDRILMGYLGLTQIYYKCGPLELWQNLKPKSKGKEGWEFVSCATHSPGHCVWNLTTTPIEITDDDESPYTRVPFLHKSCDDKSLGVPIEIINADVLPCLAQNEPVQLQVVGYPLEVEYYKNEAAYNKSRTENDIKTDMVLPIPFLANHMVNPDGTPPDDSEKKDYSDDRIVAFKGTVKESLTIPMQGEDSAPNETLCITTIQTQYGPLELLHTLAQVNEKQRGFLTKGALVHGFCILSGDAAIYRYEKGIQKDFNHNLRVMRGVFEGDSPERLRPILAPNVTYHKDIAGTTFSGIEELIAGIQDTQRRQRKSKLTYSVRYAHITTPNQPQPEFVEQHADPVVFIGDPDSTNTFVVEKPTWDYPVGTPCLILFASDHDDPESIAFIEVNDQGLITSIHTSTDSRYRFSYDDLPPTSDPQP